MRLERTLLDKYVNGAFLNKRQIGRPLRPNLRHRGHAGWLELVFAPRNRWEQLVSQFIKAMNPYIAFFTYRFHVERARDIGVPIEDMYENKFHKEPLPFNHVYAQYFHPETLMERVRNVHFYRKPRTLFKGFRVPEWATASNMKGFELDTYSRQVWDNAL